MGLKKIKNKSGTNDSKNGLLTIKGQGAQDGWINVEAAQIAGMTSEIHIISLMMCIITLHTCRIKEVTWWQRMKGSSLEGEKQVSVMGYMGSFMDHMDGKE